MLRRLTLLLFTWAFVLSLGSTARADTPPSLRVAYLGPPGWVRDALALIPNATLTDDIEQADVVVLQDVAASQVPATIAEHARRGSLVLILGPHTADLLPALFPDARLEAHSQPEGAPLSLTPLPNHDPILTTIAWNSAPQVRARTLLGGADIVPLVGYQDGRGVALARGPHGVWLVGIWLTAQSNRAFVDWPYAKYWLYAMTLRAAGRTPVPFAEYPWSPVPHAGDRRALVALMILLLGTTVALFVMVRHYSQQHPELLAHMVTDPERYRREEGETEWEEIGFHRALGGFLFILAVGVFLFIPLVLYQNVVLFGMLLPSAQARGYWSLVVNFFNTFWLLFDWGTSTAFVKFFSQYRVKAPARGFKYVQLFVWWQAITGTIQVALVVLAAAFFVPQTQYAHLAWFLIVHALIQFPGFLRVFQYCFRAFQRLDFDQMLNLVIAMSPMVLQAATVWIMSRWGAGHPAFGSHLGGALGLGLGAYAVELFTFLVGFLLYRRLGLNARLIFLAHFDWETVKSALSFGFPITLAGVIGALGYSVQVTLTVRYILNYAEVQGNWDVISPNGLIQAYSAVAALYYGLMPGLSESLSHGRRALSQYYVAQGFKWGGLMSAFLLSVLLGTGDRFILGALGKEYIRATQWLVIMALWGAVQFPAWFSDRVQEAAGRPGLQAWMLFFEQTLRILLMIVLLRPLQMVGLMLAYVIALPAKDVLAWLINHRLILRLRLYWWQTVAAPLLAAGANYVLLRLVGNAIWQPDQVHAAVLFILGLIVSLPLFAFFNGLFGGWDDAGLDEFRRSVRLASLARPYAWLFYAGTALGARLSPLHNRFPITLAETAYAEAETLTREKVTLA